ncbi:MAG: 50S ribosomal protein L13 [Bacilli bacterium]|jgi:large subunit ribosomal protein L13|nr:50S ribosomal protein L13 [Bacilli bacterium]
MTTFMQKKGDVTRQWYVVDATNQILGRLATQVATILRGKHKPTYTPHIDGGDFVIIINADKVNLTGNKLDQKKYYDHSGYPGGLRVRLAREMKEKYPVKMVERAIKGMLPKGRLGRAMSKKLFVYAGDKHPHLAQKPELLVLAERSESNNE